jgi:2-polyprenyl-3-methyl-5-hydroxy-6-metoxy-1,4-benzoquinol methylase
MIRQTAPTLDGIREDHIARYRLALQVAQQNKLRTAIDVGAGIGYGAHMLASAGMNVLAIDADPEASDYGEQHYRHPNLQRQTVSATGYQFPQADLCVMLEFVEHVHSIADILANASRACRYAVVSTPNEATNPHRLHSHPDHVRHYTPSELEELLTETGWSVTHWYTQHGKRKGKAAITEGTAGKTIIAIARSMNL